jgi:hypothetical protein
MNSIIKQKNNFGGYTNLAWDMYNEIIKANIKFWYSKTSKITSMGLGTQKGFVANPVQAPPLSLKFNNNKFKQERTQWIRLKSLGLKCT